MIKKSALVWGVCGLLTLAACGKKDAGTTGDPSAGPSAAPPPDTAADTASATTPPTTPPPPVNTAPKVAESIDACCSALSGLKNSAKGAQKAAAQRAFESCPGIAKVVREGRSTRAAALATIRAQLAGASVPGACQ